MKKFRPQQLPAGWAFRERLKGRYHGNYNWVGRYNQGPFEFGYMFRHIHYLTSHAPEVIQKRYARAHKIWMDKTRWWKSGAAEKL